MVSEALFLRLSVTECSLSDNKCSKLYTKTSNMTNNCI